jgi:hypothetical protein
MNKSERPFLVCNIRIQEIMYTPSHLSRFNQLHSDHFTTDCVQTFGSTWMVQHGWSGQVLVLPGLGVNRRCTHFVMTSSIILRLPIIPGPPHELNDYGGDQ